MGKGVHEDAFTSNASMPIIADNKNNSKNVFFFLRKYLNVFIIKKVMVFLCASKNKKVMSRQS